MRSVPMSFLRGAAGFFTAVLAAGLEAVPLPLSSCRREKWAEQVLSQRVENG